MRLALAIPCFQEAHRIPALALALARLSPGPEFLLLLDDGSTDGTAEALSTLGGQTLRHPRNLGLSAGRNTLWKEALTLGATHIAFLDADTIPAPDHLRRIAAGFLSGPYAGVGGRNEEAPATTTSDRFRARYWRQDLGPAELKDAPMLVGACSAYRLADLRDVGGFSDEFRTHGEDVDLGRRLRASGRRLLYDPSITVTHERHDGAASLTRMCFRHCRHGMRATRQTAGIPAPPALILGLARKAIAAPLSALVKHRDPALAAIAVLGTTAGLLGYAVGLLDPTHP